MDKIITVTQLKKSYGSVQAVKGLDFYVERGKLFAFLGPNGAGKSTTIDIICTFLKADSGTVLIDGRILSKDDDDIRKKIGVVFQDSVLDPLLTVRENLLIRGRFYLRRKKDLLEAVTRVTKAAGLEEFIDRPYGKLSGGQRRRADIARALLNTPKILFLDEPTTGLDPQTRKNIWDMITKLQKSTQMTVFLTTHYMEEAAAADYVMIIDHGQIAAKGTPYELRERYSCDQLRVKPAVQTSSHLTSALDDLRRSYTVTENIVSIPVTAADETISLLNELKQYIESFEVVHGTMDDVFLSITGKEIRDYA